ncbi:SGNH/GDSL hydrolase family protein [Paenibacillus sp. RC67]|uniref:SGNH/GDSL hydrolase family protein n=1 Tax=Paenibacillus sp. RC67 TaxID=3039392 RepID=UPI0024AD709F|nr:SGNH/GDSL hydrolase family protein [Paenibacillus sp. RC67]
MNDISLCVQDSLILICSSNVAPSYDVLSRFLPYEFINLGFSGSGRGEPEVARTIASIENPALYVLDYEANTGTVERMTETLPPFIDILRERHPRVPILVVSKIPYAKEHFYP